MLSELVLSELVLSELVLSVVEAVEAVEAAEGSRSMRLIPPIPIPNSPHSGPVPQDPRQGAYHPPSHRIRAAQTPQAPLP